MYSSAYDTGSSRSPGSHRHQPNTLHRQPSRQFDAYGQLPTGGLYTAEDHARGYDSQPRNYDRLNATIHSGYGYDMGGSQAWNASAFNQNNPLSTIGASSRMKQPARGRSALPTPWMDQPQPLPNFSSLPGLGPGHPNSGLGPSLRQDSYNPEMDEELIPTAIVIKNIPFAVKKEQLVQLMTDLRLPLPYAFNYHFDNGVFRGLAFANFTTADETAQVIDTMNHFELHGRKLRVEYKKMLPLAERERIEREKRERRGQLIEQHQPMTGSLTTQQSYSSLNSHVPAQSPSPVSGQASKLNVDMNDAQVLQFYSQLLLFKETAERESMTFPPSLAPSQRRIVHTLAHMLGLAHLSKGSGEQRQVHIFKLRDDPNMSPPMPQMPTSHPNEQPRRGLNRAATTDFSDVRAHESFYGNLNRQGSGFLGFPDSPGGLTAGPNLRAAKSYADLRSYTPSPVPSIASLPPVHHSRREGEYFSSTNPSVTPTATSMSQRDEGLLVNGLNTMNLGNGFGQNGSPRGLRGMMSWDRERENPGPIGGHRSFSTNYDEQSRDRSQGLPSRQPRGPGLERGTGFSRGRQNGHHGRNSDELSSQSNVEIVVE
ncbi:uncharacterized protein BDZ99DRAFT_475026 [Mytilinidion resinicola]|uniref:R3H domain protein n=1 Tax=Mytilinidion resinicola TaxID=574789 RepID=A0A6A6YU67_9PEZI|nr:uncharacterized protein BDZ99DRAFT_475026 [Mytilinidion resinicola]KAF2811467.1 hypothetical protein BDZ99DRAFT_475026 [Mytilinidion resinicola]